MQAAGMLRGIRAIYLHVFLISLIGYAHSFPLQLLPSIPGYIPVYIRHGDQPLEEINPALAEAFNEKHSVAKSVKLENIPNLADINLEEDEADTFVGKSKKKNFYPVHIRQAESNAAPSDKDKDSDKAADQNSDIEALKLLSIYELHEDGETNGRRNRHKNPKRKQLVLKEPVVKVSPLSEKEKEELKKLTIQVEKENSTPNDLSGASPNYSELPSKVPLHQDNVRHHGPVLKVEQIIVDESTDQPNTLLIKDLSQSSTDQDARDTPAAPVMEGEAPIKVQRPASILSNVYKNSPISVTDGNTNNNSSSKEEIVESVQDDKPKDLTEQNDDIAVS